MSETLLEVMAPVIEPILQQREKNARQQGMIQGTVSILREFGHDDVEIRETIAKKYGLSPGEAEMYLEKAF